MSRQNLRNAVKGVADALMIVSEPFAVSYGMDALLHTMIVDIGAGTTDFCVMRGRYPTEEDQRTLTNAGDSVDEQLMTLVRAKHPDAQFSIYMVREWKEKWSFVGEPPSPVVVTVQKAAKATPIDITSEMRRACESLVAPVTETMADLLARVEPEYQERVRHNIILAGGGSQVPGPGRRAGAGPRRLRRRRRARGGGPRLRRLQRQPRDRPRRLRGRLGVARRLSLLPHLRPGGAPRGRVEAEADR